MSYGPDDAIGKLAELDFADVEMRALADSLKMREMERELVRQHVPRNRAERRAEASRRRRK